MLVGIACGEVSALPEAKAQGREAGGAGASVCDCDCECEAPEPAQPSAVLVGTAPCESVDDMPGGSAYMVVDGLPSDGSGLIARVRGPLEAAGPVVTRPAWVSYDGSELVVGCDVVTAGVPQMAEVWLLGGAIGE